MSSPSEGFCDPRFLAVREAFEANLVEGREVGASIHLLVDGEPLVDLWGGQVDEAGTAPWTADTAVCVFSCTKVATALAAHLLIDRGLLDLDAAVADYWPEFANGGKESATVRMMLDHTVGVPAIRKRLRSGTRSGGGRACIDWELMASTLAAEEAWWEPGTRVGYHMMTFGWTVGELVRRVSGRSLGRFVAEELAGPQQADFWLGLPESVEDRVAKVITPPLYRERLSRFTRTVLDQPRSLQGLAALNTGGFNANDFGVLRAEIGAGGGVASARGLARLFRAVSLGGDGLFSPAAVARMGEVSAASARDATMLIPTRFAAGFMKSIDNRAQPDEEQDSVILSTGAFGHVGAGGSLVFVDPTNRLAFGYVLNRMSDRLLLDPRGQSLVDAVYRSLGYRDDSAGVWIR